MQEDSVFLLKEAKTRSSQSFSLTVWKLIFCFPPEDPSDEIHILILRDKGVPRGPISVAPLRFLKCAPNSSK